MTTITAVKKNNTLSICSDSLTLFGTCKEAEAYVINDTKIIQHGTAYIGFSGHPSLVDIFLNERPKNTLTEFLYTLHQTLKKHYFLLNLQNTSHSFQTIPFDLLCISPDGIIEMDYQRSVRKYTRFTAIGTGEEYALGSMQALYNTSLTSKSIANKGVEIAAKFDRKTALPAFSCSIHL